MKGIMGGICVISELNLLRVNIKNLNEINSKNLFGLPYGA